MNATPPQTYQFLSVFYYISTLSDLFYIHNIIEKEERLQSVPILNNLFEFLNHSDHEIKTKRRLVKKLLEGSELYGGKENETLDIKYVNATFDFIISNVVFSQYGGVNEYLAVMVNSANNLSLSSFKKQIVDHLSNMKFINENGSISNLSFLASRKIFEIFILPLLPPAEDDVKVVDDNFLYATAGLKLARSLELNLTKISYDDLIKMAETIEIAYFRKEIHESTLQIFALPALLFYAYEKNETFDKEKIVFLRRDNNFWSEVFFVLFSHLRDSFMEIRDKVNENNTMYQFVLAMSNFKNRTVIAEENLRKICDFQKESEYERNIPVYKFLGPPYVCPNNGKTLPNLNEHYGKQFDKIKEKYYLHMKFLLKEIFPRDLITLINSPSIIVYEARAVSSPTCTPCLPKYHNLGSSKYLFATKSEYITRYFALVQFNNSMKVLRRDIYEDEFREELGLSKEFSNLTFEISSESKILKYSSDENKTENFDVFVNRAAQNIAEKFRKELYDFGYDKTLGEKIVDIALHFIPFYDCVQDARMGNIGESIFSCTLDVISLFPIVGQAAKVGEKLGQVVKISLRTFIRRQALRLTFTGAMKQTAVGIGIGFRKVLFTKEVFKSLSLGIIQTVDPGIEFALTLTKSSGKLVRKLLLTTFESISKQFPSVNLNLAKWKRILKPWDKKGKVQTSITIGEIEGYEIYVKTFPGGVHPYGPKCIRLPSGKAELRRMIGFKREKPFVVSRVTRFGKVYYKRIYLKTGRLSVNEFKLNENGLLTPVRQPFRRHIKTIVTEGLSGRGKIMKRRTEEIDFAAEMVANSPIKMPKDQVVDVMENYFLSSRSDVSFVGTLDMNINSIIQADPGIKIILNDQIMPTYRQFAVDWINNRQISKIYGNWYINDPDLLNDLFYLNFHDLTLNEAREKLISLYGTNHLVGKKSVINLLYFDYSTLGLQKYVSIEDYFAIKYWIESSYEKMTLNGVEKLRTRNALLRLAVRQADEELEKIPIKLYHFQVLDNKIFDICYSHSVSRTFHVNEFLVVESRFKNELKRNHFFGNVIPPEKIPIVMELTFDTKYITANLNDFYYKSQEKLFVVLPKTEFVIDNVRTERYKGKEYKLIRAHNVPMEKEMWMYNLLRDIENLQTVNVRFY